MNRIDIGHGGEMQSRWTPWWQGTALAALTLVIAFAAWTVLRSPGLPLPSTSINAPTAPALRAINAHDAAAQYLQFEPNRGQAAKAVRYLSRGPTHSVEVFDDGIALSALRVPGHAGAPATMQPDAARAQLRFVGSRQTGRFEEREPAPGYASYLLGPDASSWIRGVPRFRQLRYAELYPGIDLVYYSRQGELEFDLVVKPGADASRIRLRVGGTNAPAIADNGDLLLDGKDGALRLHRPVLYQNIDGHKKVLDGRYVLGADRALSFALPDYDKRHALVIDPVFKLLYSTYLTGFHDEQVGGLVLDGQSNAYVVGHTNSDDFVVSGTAYQAGKTTTGLQYNVVITKFDASGTLIYSTYLGGTGSDLGNAIAVDAAGRAHIVGNTSSRDFPVTANAYQRLPGNVSSAYLAVISPDGSALEYGSFYGGAGGTQASAIALDATGKVALLGSAGPGLPTTAGAFKATLATGMAAYVAKFDLRASGPAQLAAASYYGVDAPQANTLGTGNLGYAMALDAGGAPWFTGQAFTTNLPVSAGAIMASPTAMTPNCGAGSVPLNSFAYVAHLSADLKTLVYASYLSGRTGGPASCSEFGHGIAIDAAGSLYVGGSTSSRAYPTTSGALQAVSPANTGFSGYAGVVTKLKADGSAILWSTYLGGDAGSTFLTGLATDPDGAVWAHASSAGGSNFPVTADALQKAHGGGGFDASLSKLDGATGALVYSTFLGGAGSEGAAGFAVDSSGTAFVAGATLSANFPVTANAFEKTFRPDFFGGADWFFSVLGSGTIGRVTPATLGNSADGSLTIYGAGFAAGAACRLSAGGTSVTSSLAGVDSSGGIVNCSFSLANVPAGAYDIAVVNPSGETFSRRAAVTIKSGTGSDITLDVLGRSTIRTGVASPFSVVLSNTGDADAYNVNVFVHYSAGLAPSNPTVANPFGLTLIDPASIPLSESTPTTRDYTAISVVRPSADGDGSSVVQLLVPVLGAGQTVALPFPLAATQLGDEQYVEAWAWKASSDSIADLSLVQGSSRAHAALGRERIAAAKLSEECRKAILDYALKKALDKLKDSILDKNVVAKAADKLNELYEQAAITGYALHDRPDLVRTGFGAAVAAEQMFPKFVDAWSASAAALGIKAGTFAEMMKEFADAMEKADSIAELAEKCKDQPKPRPQPKGKKKKTKPAGSVDPNDISGPSGDGSAARYVDGAGRFAYQIDFENLPTATLPAADVVVTTMLDPAKYDLTTLALGNVFIGSTQVTVPPGLQSFVTTLPINASLAVRVQGSLDVTRGALKWSFRSIDPATGLAPSDPTIGFLPPDKDGISGQGRVLLSVKPRAGLPESSTWSVQASVVFDANAPITTPTWLNTLDTTRPQSKVGALTRKAGTDSFDVSWSATDAGSGVSRYDVYVSDNKGAFALWKAATAATSASYDGSNGHSYGFFAIATDAAGNTELAKAEAEASITVDASSASSGGGGGGCTIGMSGQRDLGLPLLLLAALAALYRRRHARVSAKEQA